MADVVGLVIGVVALASLFSTCIDLFDRFESGRSHKDELNMAYTKLHLLKVRLLRWGHALNIETPGSECHELKQHWPEVHHAVGCSLFGITQTFEKAFILTKKYKLTASRSLVGRLLRRPQRRSQQGIEVANCAEARAPLWALLRNQTVWAIHDKQKLDSFIETLSFLIENLESILPCLEMSSATQARKSSKPLSIADAPSQANTAYPWEEASDSKSNLSRDDDIAIPSKLLHRQHEKLDINELAKQMTVVYIGSQQVEERFGVMGNVGKFEGRSLYTGNQIVSKKGFGVMGNMSEDAAKSLSQEDKTLNK